MPEAAAEPEASLIELSDAIAAVREQLVAAQLSGRQVVAGQTMNFEMGKVVLELFGEFRMTTGGAGGIKFMVHAGPGAEQSRKVQDKLVVELVFQVADGQAFVVSDGYDMPPPER